MEPCVNILCHQYEIAKLGNCVLGYDGDDCKDYISENIEHGECVPLPQLTGWLCSKCGRGNAPFTATCPCMPYPQYPVTCNIE